MDENRELESLLPLARAGDSQSRETLIGLLRARARRYADYFLGRHPGAGLDASDVAQDALIRVLKHFDPGAFPDVPHVLAWLNEVVRSVVADLRRHDVAQKRDDGRTMAGGGLFPGIASDTTGPENKAARAEGSPRLTAAVLGLPEPQRSVVRLRFDEGLSFKEIAARVAVSEGNARVLLFRAIESLRNQLGDLS